MIISLEAIKELQNVITELNSIATFMNKLSESNEITLTVGGLTKKISAKVDEESFNNIYYTIRELNDKRASNLRKYIYNILEERVHPDEESKFKTIE
jgi:hypothetical protein